MTHESMREVITAKYNFDDGDITTQYIAFLKGTTIRLTKDTINLLCNNVILISS